MTVKPKLRIVPIGELILDEKNQIEARNGAVNFLASLWKGTALVAWLSWTAMIA